MCWLAAVTDGERLSAPCSPQTAMTTVSPWAATKLMPLRVWPQIPVQVGCIPATLDISVVAGHAAAEHNGGHGVFAYIQQCKAGGVSVGTPVRECPELQACIPLSQMQIAENFGLLNVPGTPASRVGAVGVCTGNMGAGYHMPNASAVPPPM